MRGGDFPYPLTHLPTYPPLSRFYDPTAADSADTWDVALVCRNGHLVNDRSRAAPARNAKWCTTCGAATLSACPGCREPIAGFHYRLDPEAAAEPVTVPRYCSSCGRPFPWTERAMSGARALIRELSALDQYERDQLRRSIDHIVRETPQTPLAIVRIRKALDRVGGDTAKGLQEILLSVANESVKDRLFPSP